MKKLTDMSVLYPTMEGFLQTLSFGEDGDVRRNGGRKFTADYTGKIPEYKMVVPYIHPPEQKITPALSIFNGLTIESLTLNPLPGGKGRINFF